MNNANQALHGIGLKVAHDFRFRRVLALLISRVAEDRARNDARHFHASLCPTRAWGE